VQAGHERNRWLTLCAGIAVVVGCSSPGVSQRDPLLPVPAQRPEITVDADMVPEIVEDSRSVLDFRGRLADRNDPGARGSGGRLARVVLVFDLDGEEPAPDLATIGISAPYKNLPLLRIGDVYRVRWEVASKDPMGLPDVRLEIRSDEEQLLFLISSGSSLPDESLIEGLALRSAQRPAFLTDFKAAAGCRVRRRHYATRVRHPSLVEVDARLMPADKLELYTEAERWRLTVLDNSVALKGGCEKLVAQELAHRTVVLQLIR